MTTSLISLLRLVNSGDEIITLSQELEYVKNLMRPLCPFGEPEFSNQGGTGCWNGELQDSQILSAAFCGKQHYTWIFRIRNGKRK